MRPAGEPGIDRRRHARRATGLSLVMAALGCAGRIDAPLAGQPVGSPPSGAVTAVPIHRLNNLEYDNTIRALLGVEAYGAEAFIPDARALGFDNIAGALGMTDAQYEQYFDAADVVVERAFADGAARSRVMTCTGATAADACLAGIIKSFGARAWRRPLSSEDVSRFQALAAHAMKAGEDFTGAVKQVVKTMLASPHFLYRLEIDPDPRSGKPRALDGYELASRLSYLTWSTMPDETLFALAASGDLRRDDVLAAQLDRMLGDPRAKTFIASFAGQWLGTEDMRNHDVETTAYPAWSDGMRSSMIKEQLLYFDEFLSGPGKMTEFFTMQANYVDAPLGKVYGMKVTSRSPVRMAIAGRVGFMGLGGFLTQTSFSYRTAPTLRGKWVLENLLCQTIRPPPPSVPKIDDENPTSKAAQSLNVRDRLEDHRTDVGCAACHKLLDPIGLGLENFDGIGAHRDRYANGDAIDASGKLPDGTTFRGLEELAGILGKDRRFTDCASRRLLTYALSRDLSDGDEPYLEAIRRAWAQRGWGLKVLLEEIVMSPLFRSRRGEPS